MNPIRKAVIPVAGLGTRHFPASHAAVVAAGILPAVEPGILPGGLV